MTEKFEVGEVAILVDEFGRPINEVTIDSVDAASRYVCQNGHGLQVIYHVAGWPEDDWLCGCVLRKKRPPQDWKTLCNLTDLPVTREKELV